MNVDVARAAQVPPLPSLTGLRFVAALLVFGFHITLMASPIPPNLPINLFADPVAARVSSQLFHVTGYIGVSFFFVLSGFLLAWTARPGESLPTFWRRRFLKLFPNHLVMWVLSMVLFAGAVTPMVAAVSNLLFLGAYSPDASVNVAVNPPTWTLASEALFYLLFPLLIAVIHRIPGTALWGTLGVLAVLMVAIQMANLTLVPTTPTSALTPVSSAQFWFGYLFPPARLPEFVIGCVAARLVREGRWPRLPAWTLVALILLGYGLASFVPFVWKFGVVTIVPIIAVIATIATRDLRRPGRFLASRPLQWLGTVSFGFYLVQGVTIFWARSLFGVVTFETPVAALLILAFFVITLLAGWVLYALVEKPAMTIFARTERPRSTAQTQGERHGTRT
ncbi:acyltransferase family protein [Mycetocola saprophilus]|uniref:acyltransferase family protein n=1 Tax=Mycetocola saprophilus TaxID=76636 RepID=UPI003BF32984